MNFKKIALFALIFLILGTLYYFLETSNKTKKKEEPPAFIPGFDKQQAASVLIKSPEKGAAHLQTKDGNWMVSADNRTFSADTAPVDKLLETVANLKAETIASKNPKNFGALEVTEDKGVEVHIRSASQETLAHFYVGKSGPDVFSTYVRKKDSGQVILTGTILKTVFEKELKDWRDKSIFSLNKDDIIEYTVAGDVTLNMKKDDQNLWQVLGPEPEAFTAQKDAAEGAPGEFAALKGVAFAEGELSEFELDKPIRTITAILKDGTAKTLLVGKEKNTYQRFVKAQDKDTLFVLENYKLEKMSPSLDKLKPEEQEQAQPADNASAPSPKS